MSADTDLSLDTLYYPVLCMINLLSFVVGVTGC